MEPGKFPGALYPPGAAPRYTPSKKSPFAIAIKRCIAHCGFWPWDPPSYDEFYSDAVAYGTSDPEKVGVRAFQQWSGTIEPTGNWGSKSFNFARSVLVPQGRPQAGNPAWDQICIQLTAQAHEEAYPPEPETTLRQRALDKAITQLGVREDPPDSNGVKYCEWYYGNNTVGPWCAMFVTWCFEQVGDSPSFVRGERYAYCPYVVSDSRDGRFGLSVTSSPVPGDLCVYDWQGYGSDGYSESFDHIGIFEKWLGNSVFSAIEGNTSAEGSGGSQSNGGEVCRRTRDVNNQGTVFVRVAEP